MCILCVIQKWSRRVATMLPWLVIPLIGLWALSQLLPPAFRFEITSPRLASLFVLLVTLFWYEILMPQLSAWRVRRNALRQERKRFEAIEMEKLRKTATRRCRNCLTPYRDQNPGGGRFMCSYCGHISKRPVLDLPVPPGLGISNSGVIRDLIAKGGKLLNGKTWAENGWMCGQEWPETGNRVGGSVVGKSSHWRMTGCSVFGGDGHCLAEKSYSGIVIFSYKLLTSIFSSGRWVWRKIFRVISTGDESSSSNLQKELRTKGFESEINYHERRGEKARRKAEEKRQARLEKELLEEEERKQREEVARLVEEQRRLRDEKFESEKYNGKSPTTSKEKDKKEAEKKRNERRKDRDRISSKSNSDAEELERKGGKEIDRKRQQIDRREQKLSSEDAKGDCPDIDHGHGARNFSASNGSLPNTGTKYFDRMKGTFLSSSKAFTGGSFFGKGANVLVSAAKETRVSSSSDHAQSSVRKRDIYLPDCVSGSLPTNRDEKNVHRPVLSEPQVMGAPKKPWHQLFTRSSSVPASSNTNVVSGTNTKPEAVGGIQHLPGGVSSVQMFEDPISIRLPSNFTSLTYPYQHGGSSLGFSPPIEPKFPRIQEESQDALPEEPELFEDPCYVPDPASLLGPVSESLNNFLLDTGLEKPQPFKDKPSLSPESSKPSPIESPLSRSRIADEKHIAPNWLLGRDGQGHVEGVNADEKGTYQMWTSPPIVQEGLGLLDGLGLLNKSNSGDAVHSSLQKMTTSLFANEGSLLPCTLSPRRNVAGNGQNDGMHYSATSSKNHDSWFQNAFFPPVVGNNTQLSCGAHEKGARNELTFAGDHHSVVPPSANCWPMNSAKGNEKQSSIARPMTSVGGLFTKPDVQSFW